MTGIAHVSRRNARVALVAAFLSDLAFILPIWILFGTNELGLSITLTTALFMVIWLGSGLLEIPTGALADRLGRKRVFIIGAALLALYPIVYIFELPVWAIFVVSIFSAFGSALRSGTLIALTHDSFQKDNRSDEDYHKFLSNEKVVTFVARALSGVAGGALYAFDPHGPYIAIFAAYILLLAVGFFAIDTATERSKLSNSMHIKETLRAMFRTRIISLLIISYIAAQLVGEAIWTAYQPFFESDGVTPQGIGLVFTTIAVISAIGAYSTRFIMKRVGVLCMEVLFAAIMLLTTILLFAPSNTLHLLAVVPAAFAFGMSITPIIATTQKYVAAKFHSTALSIISVAQYVTYGVASLYIGVVIDWLGIAGARKVLLVEAMIAAAILLGIYFTNKKTDEVITPRTLNQEEIPETPADMVR